MATVPPRMNELEKDKDLVFVCRSGARSAQVCMFLQQQGFERVYNLRGGLIAWASSGHRMMLPKAV
jgi:rhodanese-related sulfurtransferase